MLVGVESGLLWFLAINLHWKMCVRPGLRRTHLGIP